MNATTTMSPLLEYSIADYYPYCGLFGLFAIIAITICIFIMSLVWRNKPRLYTANHLLMCNTCFASIFYCVITISNYSFLMFGQWQTSDISCRFRAYFAYSSVAGIVYSYLLQAISRFIFSFLSAKYRWLTTLKNHFILISIQWISVLLITSPSIITNDIIFYPDTLCWVSFDHLLHMAYTAFAYYILPFLMIIIIYISIYYKVSRNKRNTTVLVNSMNGNKRDLQLLRNIIILLSIYLVGGSFTLLFFLTQIKLIYLLNLFVISVCVVIEKICTIILDRELREIVKTLTHRRITTVPIHNAPVQGIF